MLILLPPSEGKSPAVRGTPVELDQLHFPELNSAREQVLDSLVRTSGSVDAGKLLGVGASLEAEVQRNAVLRSEPSAPAYSVYTGVLYDALGYRTLTPVQRRKARESIIVVSALWGVIGFADPIPAYRLSMTVNLPGPGKLTSFWRSRLSSALNTHAGDSLIVDCRSSSYATVWAPPPERSAAVNVFQQRNGKRTVVSHFAKHTRGELARHLLTRRGKAPSMPQQLLAAARERWDAELVPASGQNCAQLNIILPG